MRQASPFGLRYIHVYLGLWASGTYGSGSPPCLPGPGPAQAQARMAPRVPRAALGDGLGGHGESRGCGTERVSGWRVSRGAAAQAGDRLRRGWQQWAARNGRLPRTQLGLLCIYSLPRTHAGAGAGTGLVCIYLTISRHGRLPRTASVSGRVCCRRCLPRQTPLCRRCRRCCRCRRCLSAVGRCRRCCCRRWRRYRPSVQEPDAGRLTRLSPDASGRYRPPLSPVCRMPDALRASRAERVRRRACEVGVARWNGAWRCWVGWYVKARARHAADGEYPRRADGREGGGGGHVRGFIRIDGHGRRG